MLVVHLFLFSSYICVCLFLHSELRERNVSVNAWAVNERWLFSLLWCSGVTSVTTNACHVFKDMNNPDWHLVNPDLLLTITVGSAILFVIDTGLCVYVTHLYPLCLFKNERGLICTRWYGFRLMWCLCWWCLGFLFGKGKNPLNVAYYKFILCLRLKKNCVKNQNYIYSYM